MLAWLRGQSDLDRFFLVSHLTQSLSGGERTIKSRYRQVRCPAGRVDVPTDELTHRGPPTTAAAVLW